LHQTGSGRQLLHVNLYDSD